MRPGSSHSLLPLLNNLPLPCPRPLRAVSLPEARSMEPRQLQQAVTMTMAELRKGRVRRMLDWAKLLYRWGGWRLWAPPALNRAPLAAAVWFWGVLLCPTAAHQAAPCSDSSEERTAGHGALSGRRSLPPPAAPPAARRRLGAVGWGAFSMCTNPWVAKAILAALWSCLRLMGRFVVPVPL